MTIVLHIHVYKYQLQVHDEKVVRHVPHYVHEQDEEDDEYIIILAMNYVKIHIVYMYDVDDEDCY